MRGDASVSEREALKGAIRSSVVLVVLVVPLLAACWLVGAQRSLGQVTLGIYIAAVVLLIACEHWLSFDRTWGSALRGGWTDFLYVGVATLMDKVAFVVCVTAIAAVGRELAGVLHISLWPTDWNLALQLVLALVIADVATYWRHRLFHRSSRLWRFHQIHHSMTELYWIRSAYTHPLEQLCILMAIMLPISLLGAGEELVAAVGFLFGVSGLLQHANIDSRSSVLNYVFATPEVHRLHHRADEQGNRSNFSAFFAWMDVLCGTYLRPGPAPAPIRVGLAGVTAFPRDFLSHLALPFRREPAPEREWEPARGSVPAPHEP